MAHDHSREAEQAVLGRMNVLVTERLDESAAAAGKHRWWLDTEPVRLVLGASQQLLEMQVGLTSGGVHPLTLARMAANAAAYLMMVADLTGGLQPACPACGQMLPCSGHGRQGSWNHPHSDA